MLQKFGACDGSPLGNVPDENQRNPPSLGSGDTYSGAFPHLGGGSRPRLHLSQSHGLNAVHHEKIIVFQGGEKKFGVFFRTEIERGRKSAYALRPGSYLGERFFSGNVKNALALPGHSPAYLKKQGGFPYARISRQKSRASGNPSSSENPIELLHFGGEPGDFRNIHYLNGRKPPNIPRSDNPFFRNLHNLFLFESSPFAAAGTFSRPGGKDSAAVGTYVSGIALFFTQPSYPPFFSL
jgi:hypothetical protein